MYPFITWQSCVHSSLDKVAPAACGVAALDLADSAIAGSALTGETWSWPVGRSRLGASGRPPASPAPESASQTVGHKRRTTIRYLRERECHAAPCAVSPSWDAAMCTLSARDGAPTCHRSGHDT